MTFKFYDSVLYDLSIHPYGSVPDEARESEAEYTCGISWPLRRRRTVACVLDPSVDYSSSKSGRVPSRGE